MSKDLMEGKVTLEQYVAVAEVSLLSLSKDFIEGKVTLKQYEAEAGYVVNRYLV